MKANFYIIKADPFNTMRYYGLNDNGVKLIETSEELKLGKTYQLTGEYTNYVFKAEQPEEREDSQLEKKVEQLRSFEPAEVRKKIDAPALNDMTKLFDEAARVIATAVLELRQIKIRYDDDADGIFSALIIKNALEAFAKNKTTPLFFKYKESTNGAVYKPMDYSEDLSTTLKGSLLVFLDHAANEESREAMEHASKTFETLVVDHHPPAKKLAMHHLVSPFRIANCVEPSSYNTGLLAFETSRRIAPEIENKLFDYCKFSMQADYSSFRLPEQFKEPIVVDYLVDDLAESASLEYYEKTVNDAHLVGELFHEQKVKIESALAKALRKAKVHEGEHMRIASVDVTGISKKNAFPGSSKLHNAVQIHFAKDGKPTASFIYTSEVLSFRATQSCISLGYSANKIIGALKKMYGKFGFTGGGHNVAASTRFPKEYGREIVETALKMVIENNG